MNIKKAHDRKPFIIGSIAALAAVLLIGWYAYASGAWPFAATNNETATGVQQVDSTSSKDEDTASASADTQSTVNTETKKPIQNDSVDQTSKKNSDLQVAITSAQQNGSTVNIRTLIESVTTGTCKLTMTNTANNNTTSKQASVQALSNSSTCEGFDIPASELSAGTWRFTVSVKTSSGNGSDSSSVEVKQ